MDDLTEDTGLVGSTVAPNGIIRTHTDGHTGFPTTFKSGFLEFTFGILHLPNKDNVASLFGVSLTSMVDINVLTKRIVVGEYEDVLTRLTIDQMRAVMDAIMVVWQKLLAKRLDNSCTGQNSSPNQVLAGASGASTSDLSKCKANFRSLLSDNLCDDVELTIPKKVVEANNWRKYGLTRIMMNYKCFFFFKFDTSKGLKDVLENGPWMIRNNPIILKKWTMHTRPLKEELTRILMGSFARCLIEVKADDVLKESVTMGIPLLEGSSFFLNRRSVWSISGSHYMVVNKRKNGKTGTSSNSNNRNGVKIGGHSGKLNVKYVPKDAVSVSKMDPRIPFVLNCFGFNKLYRGNPSPKKEIDHTVADLTPEEKERDGENLKKMKEKGDPCIFVGYSTTLKGYRVYNKRTRLIVESILINFDDLKEIMASVHNSAGPVPQ
nr:hypothetical protein [Tanacetum cinerariifolium]